MQRSGMAGLGWVVAVAAAMVLVLCDLPSGPGLTPAHAGLFSKAKDGAKAKSDTDKDKQKESSSSTASSAKGKSSGSSVTIGKKPGGSQGKGSSSWGAPSAKGKSPGGGIFIGAKPGSKPGKDISSATTPPADKDKPSGGGLFGGIFKKPSTSGGSGGGSSGSTGGGSPGTVGGIFSRGGGGDGGNDRQPPKPVVRPPDSGGGYFDRTRHTGDGPVWRPTGKPAVFSSKQPWTQRRDSRGYFAHVNTLKAHSHVRYVDPHPRVVDWWWWWYPYDLRYYHWHYGYFDPFAPDYAFIFVYVGGRPYYPPAYYVYRPLPAPVIVITRAPDDGYSTLSRVEGSLGEAVRDLESGWRDESLNGLMRHVDREAEIRVYYGDTFSHTMNAREFEDLTRDALATTRTVSMRFDRVVRLSDDWAKAKGRHIFYDPNGDRREVYVYYLLEQVRDGWRREWLIREIGQGPEPY